MAGNALNARNAAAAVLNETIRDATRYKEKDNPNQRLLKNKLDKLTVDKDDLFRKHVVYADASKTELSDPTLTAYINPLMDSASDLADELYILIDGIETAASDLQRQAALVDTEAAKLNERNVIQLQCDNDEHVLTETIDAMKAIYSDESKADKDNAILVQSYLDQIDGFRLDIEKHWAVLRSLYKDDELTLFFAQQETLKKTIADVTTKGVSFVRKCIPESFAPSKSSSSDIDAQSERSTHADRFDSSLKTERVGNPHFNGDIRTFARFKSDFSDFVVPKYSSKKEQVYVLKRSCLQGVALKIVENLTDIDSIWERLQSRFGDEVEITNCVIKGIQALTLKPGADADRFLVKFVDEVERGVQDLDAINGKHHIANAMSVKMFEEKLPRPVVERWYQRQALLAAADSGESSSSADHRFQDMFTFLQQERKQSERLLLLKDKPNKKDKDEEKPNKKDKVDKLGGGGGGFSGGGSGGARQSCLVHPNGNHLTRKCRKFLEKTEQDRGQLVQDANACALCLSTNHTNKPCPFIDKWDKCGIGGCDKAHSRLVHGCTIRGIGCHASITAIACQVNQTFLLFELVLTDHGAWITVFWDGGSTISLVSKEFVLKHNLHGVPVMFDLETIGGTVTTRRTWLHEITIVDREGNPHLIKAFQIDEICSNLHQGNTDQFAKLFPSTTPRDIRRPKGKVDILIGNNYATVHPTKGCTREGLVLYESMFGTGKILGGSHEKVEENTVINSNAHTAAHARVTNVRVNVEGLLPSKPALDFITTEAFGVQVPPQCASCKGCKQCKFEVTQLSRLEQRELAEIRKNMTLDPIAQEWTVSYGFREDPSCLSNNKSQALALAVKKEKRLEKAGLREQYDQQFQSLVDDGIYVEITDAEEKSYEGPVFYADHQPVLKPTSVSTPLRIVINPSLKFHGVCPNDIWIKGPNSLNDMFAILLKFRTHKFALVGDIRKMYTRLRTTPTEKHLRRLIWRLNEEESWRTFGVTKVMFGDRPAATITSVAIRETADLYKHVNEEAADKIKNDTYVDDVTTGTDDEENIPILKRDIATILHHGGMEMKGFVATGDTSEESRTLLGSGDVGRVLGVNWSPADDVLSVSVRINVSRKIRGVRTESDYSLEQIPSLIEITFTRRICQGIVYSCYDPYGQATPVTIKMKVALRDLFSKELNLSWDDPLPEDIKKKWVQMLQVIKSVERITFPRCIKPAAPTVGLPELIMCNDASTEAMCATAHVRWQLQDGSYECFLYASKTRVAPLVKESVPRLEAQSAVISVRLSNTITTHSDLDFKEVYYILDSKCTLAAWHKDSIALKEWMANRQAEVLKKSNIEQWFHIESKKNIADLATRTNARIDEIAEGSDWQKGPTWMRFPKEQWPTSQDITGAAIPSEELSNKSLCAFASSEKTFYDIERFRGRSYTFLLRVTATVVSMLRNRSLLKAIHLTAEEVSHAESLCIKASMYYTKQEFDAGKLKSLGAKVEEDGIITVNSRASETMKAHYGSQRFPILTYKDPLSHIWIQHVHEEEHSGITKTLAKSRRMFWIVRGRRLSEKIKRSCYQCRLLDKKLAEQQMAPLPTSRTVIAPSFHTTSMDLFGPIEICDTVKKRTLKKVWGVIFNCTVTRAMYIDLTADYGTDSILQTLRRFVCIRGCPGEIQSDQGSQLVAAAKEIAELTKKWDWTPIHQWAATNKINWKLAPAEGQHQNGLSESLVKLTKRSIQHKVAGKVLTFSELQTVLFEICNIINSRPIGIITGSDPECPSPITPNDLILGRATSSVPQGPFDQTASKKITKRFRFLQELVSQWWSSWYQSVFPKLVPSYKWIQRHRNLRVGDVCLIRYRNESRSTYRLGKVAEVKLGTDGLVRTVVLKYKLPTEKTFRTVDRPIHGVSVIVPVEEQSTLNPDAHEFVPQ